MKYLKEELREDIQKAAVQEFSLKGYQNASMRSIAAHSNISVGNIYRYFDSKESLFIAIMEPVWQETLQLLYVDRLIPQPQLVDNLSVEEIVSRIIAICQQHPELFRILISNSEGSPYAHVKEKLIGIVTRRFEEELIPHLYRLNRTPDPLLPFVLASTIIESFFIIIVRCTEDIPRMEQLMRQMLAVILRDLDKRIG